MSTQQMESSSLSASSGRQSHTDVVVVGGGAAGLTAAITAAELGRRVVLLEKERALGGTTALSVGSISAAVTRSQRRRRIHDSVDLFERDMATANGADAPLEPTGLSSLLARESGPAFDWISELGVEFFGPTIEPPFEVARMNNVLPSARSYIVVLAKRARQVAVDIRTDERVIELIEENGAICGVRTPRESIRSRAVILAAGDFSANPDMKRQWLSPESSRLPAINPASTGDGIALGISAGGRVVNAHRALEELRFLPSRTTMQGRLPAGKFGGLVTRLAMEHLPRPLLAFFAREALTSWVAPSTGLVEHGAVLVDSEGRRFGDETTSPARALSGQRDNVCYLIIDARIARTFSAWPHPISTFPGIAYAYIQDYERFRPDATHRASSLASLAQRIGVPEQALVRSVADYNQAARERVPDEFGRIPEAPLAEPDFYALGPLGAFVTLTDGGLAVSDRCEVLGTDGPVSGLYAAGSTGQGGLLLKNHGLHVGWAVVSGRVAGRAAARARS